jgi:large subunit ribosomal protein L3
MAIGILGKKIGMTQLFQEDGKVVPVTLIEAGPCSVSAVKTREKDGYDALQLSMQKTRRRNFVKEVRDFKGEYKKGDTINVDIFKADDFVDVVGTSIGKGFQGGIKRWHWSGGDAGRGSMFHRAPGSIGASSYPSRVFKGQHLPGHMGHARVTVQNLKVLKVDKENNLLAVKGAIPGHKGSFLIVKEALKRPRPAGKEEKAKEEKTKEEKAKK